jgi:DNA-binding SARP family transcriptional activator
MARLNLALFGGFHALLDDAPLAGIYDHVRALLAYLATESDRPHRREFLAELLWPDEPEEVARRNLRQALSRLRAALGDRDATENPFLLIDRTSIQFNPQSDHVFDVAAFISTAPPEKQSREADLTVADVPWLEAVCDLYRGHFLNQFYLPENSTFDQWASARAEDYKQRALHYLSTLTDYFGSAGDLQRGIAAARRQIELEPWRERAHRQLMHLLAKSGQRSAALAQYNVCRALLLDELGVEPEGETEALRQSILRGEVEPASTPAASARAPSGRRQVTVLLCGLAEPAGIDPEDFADSVRAFKQRCRELAVRFEAYIEDSHGGAQIMIFGFPQAHEDDAQRALHASQRILADTRKLAAQHKTPLCVRGGIHTGLIHLPRRYGRSAAGPDRHTARCCRAAALSSRGRQLFGQRRHRASGARPLRRQRAASLGLARAGRRPARL